MAGEFGQFKAPESQLSDIESVQAPVQDDSSAAALSSIAQGVQSTGSAFTSIASSYQRASAKEAKRLAEEQDIEYSNRYDYALEKMSAAIDSGEMNSIQARTFLRKTKQELVSMGASADKLNQTEAKTLKTLSGKSLAEGTEEERRQIAFEKQYVDSNFFNPNFTEDEHEAAKALLVRDNAAKTSYDAEVRAYSLEEKQAKRDERAIKNANRKIEEANRREVNRILVNYPVTINNELARLEASYQENMSAPGANPAEVTANYRRQVENFFNSHAGQIRRISQESKDGLPVQSESALKTLSSYKDTALKYIGTDQYNKEMAGLKEKLQVTVDYDVLNSSKRIQVADSANRLLGQGAQHLRGVFTDAGKELNDFIVKALEREDGGPGPIIEENTESAEALDKVLGSNLENFGKVDGLGQPMVLVEDLKPMVSGLLAYTSDSLGRVDMKTADLVLKRLTDPNLGKFISQVGLTNQDLENAKLALNVHKDKAADSFQLFMQEALAAEGSKATLASTGPRGKIAAGKVPDFNDFELVFESDQVLLKGKTEQARKSAHGYNQRISGPLTRIVQADAHLSGNSYQSVFNAWSERLLFEEDEEGSDERGE